ncbi:hypothetical protein EC988_005363, partial [Linderina pennispora]
RIKAEEEARAAAEEARLQAEEEARIVAEAAAAEEARIAAEATAAEEARLKAEAEAKTVEEEARLQAEEEARVKAEEGAKAAEEAKIKAEEEAKAQEAHIAAEAAAKEEEEARGAEEAKVRAEEEARAAAAAAEIAAAEAAVAAEIEAEIRAKAEGEAAHDEHIGDNAPAENKSTAGTPATSPQTKPSSHFGQRLANSPFLQADRLSGGEQTPPPKRPGRVISPFLERGHQEPKSISGALAVKPEDVKQDESNDTDHLPVALLPVLPCGLSAAQFQAILASLHPPVAPHISAVPDVCPGTDSPGTGDVAIHCSSPCCIQHSPALDAVTIYGSHRSHYHRARKVAHYYGALSCPRLLNFGGSQSSSNDWNPGS